MDGWGARRAAPVTASRFLFLDRRPAKYVLRITGSIGRHRASDVSGHGRDNKTTWALLPPVWILPFFMVHASAAAARLPEAGTGGFGSVSHCHVSFRRKTVIFFLLGESAFN